MIREFCLAWSIIWRICESQVALATLARARKFVEVPEVGTESLPVVVLVVRIQHEAVRDVASRQLHHGTLRAILRGQLLNKCSNFARSRHTSASVFPCFSCDLC